MFTSNIFTHSLEQIFSDALQSSSFHTQLHSYKLKSTFSYGLHKHILTYEQAYTNEQLHTHSWKCAYTCIPSNLLTHSLTKKSPICSQSHSRTFPQIQHNHKEHHTYMLTDEYAHTYHEVHTFTYTHRCSSIFTCTHLHINSQKYTPLSCALTCIHSDTHEYFNIHAHGHKCTDT